MRANQRGSVISFIIVGALLVLAATGAFYWIGHHVDSSAPQVKEPEVSIPAPTAPDKTDSPKDKPAKENSSTKKSTSSNSTSTPDKNSAATTTPQAGDKLPHTGPTETFITLLAVGLLTAVSVAYIRSCRSTVSL